MLQEVHVKVILALHGFLYTQLENVGEVAGGIKPQINNRIANTESRYTRKHKAVRRIQCKFKGDCRATVWLSANESDKKLTITVSITTQW